MKNIAVIGSADSVRGFKALGLSVFVADTSEQAADIIKNLAQNIFAVIYVTEILYSGLISIINRYTDNPDIAIIPIPGTFGNNGIGMSEVSKCVERAVGSDILEEN